METNLTPAMRAAKQMDWTQVVLNGGPPCFHICEDGRFCGRAERWDGHGAVCEHHKFISLADMVGSAVLGAGVDSLKPILASNVGKGLLLFMGQVKPSQAMVKTDEGLLRWTGILSGFVAAVLADVSEERMDALIAQINDFGDGENPRPEWTAALCNFLRWEARDGREKEADMMEGQGTPS